VNFEPLFERNIASHWTEKEKKNHDTLPVGIVPKKVAGFVKDW